MQTTITLITNPSCTTYVVYLPSSWRTDEIVHSDFAPPVVRKRDTPQNKFCLGVSTDSIASWINLPMSIVGVEEYLSASIPTSKIVAFIFTDEITGKLDCPPVCMPYISYHGRKPLLKYTPSVVSILTNDSDEKCLALDFTNAVHGGTIGKNLFTIDPNLNVENLKKNDTKFVYLFI